MGFNLAFKGLIKSLAAGCSAAVDRPEPEVGYWTQSVPCNDATHSIKKFRYEIYARDRHHKRFSFNPISRQLNPVSASRRCYSRNALHQTSRPISHTSFTSQNCKHLLFSDERRIQHVMRN